MLARHLQLRVCPVVDGMTERTLFILQFGAYYEASLLKAAWDIFAVVRAEQSLLAQFRRTVL